MGGSGNLWTGFDWSVALLSGAGVEMSGEESQVDLRRVHPMALSHLDDVMHICEWLLTLLRWPMVDELMFPASPIFQNQRLLYLS